MNGTTSDPLFDAIVDNNFATFVQLLGGTEIDKTITGFIRKEVRTGILYIHVPTHISPFLLCAKFGRYEMLEFVIQTYSRHLTIFNINQQDSNGHNVVANIILSHEIDDRNCKINCIKLLTCNLSFNINTVNKHRESVLMLAVKVERHYEIVKLLLKHKQINVSLHDQFGNTVLMSASRRQHATIIRLLLQNTNVSVNDCNKCGQTALYQCLCDNEEAGLQCVRQLSNYSDIDVNYAKGRNFTAMELTLEHDMFLTHAMLMHGRI